MFRMFLAVAVCVLACGCDVVATKQPVSASGVKRAKVHVDTGSDGHTVEQKNILERLKIDNQPGSIKHLYVISAYSGQTLIYSTVKGKVTSSGKRLNPVTVSAAPNDRAGRRWDGILVDINGETHATSEVLQDDGTYGSSIEYLYWFDQRDVFHQHYLGGGQIVHVSNEPLNVSSVTINMELTKGGDSP